MDTLRKDNIKNFKKHFDKDTSKIIEFTIFNYAEEYANNEGIPFMMQNIYTEKIEEFLKYFNDDNNKLKENIINGNIQPCDIMQLKPDELEPDKYEKIIKKKEIEEKNKDAAFTTVYKCSKCKRRKCKAETRQTRAADEASTLFITCLVCGNVDVYN